MSGILKGNYFYITKDLKGAARKLYDKKERPVVKKVEKQWLD
jgi:hypothetical protein